MKKFKNSLKKCTSKIKALCVNEDGMETIEWAILLIIVVGLIAKVYDMKSSVDGKMNVAIDQIKNLDVGGTTPNNP